MKQKLTLYFLLTLALTALLAACQPQTIVETVVVTQVVTEKEEVVVTKEVEVKEVVTKEVEVEVEKIVEVTPVPGRCAPTDPSEVEVIKIGATVPLSAPGSVTGGRAMQTAINIAVKEINDAGGVLGKPIDVVFYDTSSLPERGTAAMEYFVTQECVVAVIGEYHSSSGVAMKEISHKYHMPTVFSETWNDTITGAGYEEVFRIAPASSMVASADANYIEALGASFVVIVTENSDYGIPAAEATTEKLAERGIEAETYPAEMGTQDFQAIIDRILEGPTPDVVLVLLTGETSYNFEQQAAENGLMPNDDTVCIANQVAINSEDFWNNVPDGNYCVFRKVGLVPSLANDVTKAFEAEYRKSFDRFPESYALEAYDSMKIMAAAIEAAGTLDPDAIIAALEATDLILAQGHYYFPYGTGNPVPDDQPAWMWHQWPDPAVLFLQYDEEGQSGDEAAVVFPEVYWTHDTFLIPFGTTP
ncbi:MAG: ABC transporter substrate-binding protein [Anaerolineales bacterium]